MTIDLHWKTSLISLVERDQFIQEALLNKGILEDAYQPELEKVHMANGHKLQAIIKQKIIYKEIYYAKYIGLIAKKEKDGTFLFVKKYKVNK